MFMVTGRLQRIVFLFSRWATAVSSFVPRLLAFYRSASGNIERQDSGKSCLPRPSSPCRQSDAPNQPTPASTSPCADSPPLPPTIQYIPVPGPWQRAAHPHWNESVFEIPKDVGPGEIYYITKGAFVSMGGHAIVERSPCGHIIKSHKMNPYIEHQDRKSRESLVREASIYRLIGHSSFVPRVVSWCEESLTLTLERQVHGDLDDYVRQHLHNSQTQLGLRQKWAIQAAKALAVVHAAGVIHHDVAPRNFVLDEHLDLRICDFGGSSFAGSPAPLCGPGPRYQSRPFFQGFVPSIAEDIFALGSVIYFIMAGEDPYHGLEEDEVERRFALGDFPNTGALAYGTVVQECWAGRLTTAQEVVQVLSGSRSS